MYTKLSLSLALVALFGHVSSSTTFITPLVNSASCVAVGGPNFISAGNNIDENHIALESCTPPRHSDHEEKKAWIQSNQWNFTADAQNPSTLINGLSGGCLDSGSFDPASTISFPPSVQACNGADSQLWISSSNNQISPSVAPGYCLTVPSGEVNLTFEGTNFGNIMTVIHCLSDSLDQKFTLNNDGQT